VGYLVAMFLGLGEEEIFVSLLMGWLLVVYFGCALFRYEPAPCVYGAAFAALVVHLLGAGGIGMPAITQTLVLLVVLGGGETLAAEGWKGGPRSCPRSWPARTAILLVGLALFLGCLATGLIPNAICRSKVAEGDEMYGKRNLSQAESKFQLAAEADPLSPVPWERLSGLAYQRWLEGNKDRPDEFERSIEWQREAIARDPRNSGGYSTLAHLYLGRFKHTGQMADASAAVDAARQALTLYPNHAITQSQLAEGLSLAGRPDEARQVARRALELDAINEHAGHIDKRLPKGRLELMQKILAADRKTPKDPARPAAGAKEE
jgi:hypothetical protein